MTEPVQSPGAEANPERYWEMMYTDLLRRVDAGEFPSGKVTRDREAIARIIDPQGFDPDNLAYEPFYIDLWKRRAFEKADAILSLPAPPPADGRDDKVRHGIYIASKTKHAARWVALRNSGVPIISTWIDEAGEGQSADLNDLWIRCIRESSSCELLIAYREPDEMLKGGWIEIGAALQAGVPVYAVGLEEYTIAKHHGLKHFPNIEAAFETALAQLQSEGDGTK